MAASKTAAVHPHTSRPIPASALSKPLDQRLQQTTLTLTQYPVFSGLVGGVGTSDDASYRLHTSPMISISSFRSVQFEPLPPHYSSSTFVRISIRVRAAAQKAAYALPFVGRRCLLGHADCSMLSIEVRSTLWQASRSIAGIGLVCHFRTEVYYLLKQECLRGRGALFQPHVLWANEMESTHACSGFGLAISPR